MNIGSGSAVINIFSCSTQVTMKFQLQKTQKVKNRLLFAFKLSDVVLIMLLNVKVSSFMGFLTFAGLIDYV